MVYTESHDEAGGAFEIATDARGTARLTLHGRLDAESTGRIWSDVMKLVGRTAGKALVVDAGGVDYCDGAGAGLLLEMTRRQVMTHGGIEFLGLRDDIKRFVDMLDPGIPPAEEPSSTSWRAIAVDVGRATAEIIGGIHNQVRFIGELTAALFSVVRHPRHVRWKDALLLAETCGVNAIAIVSLIGFLIGMILAFQSAVPLKRFGAEIFVADLVSIALLRELGPLMTAIILAGRTGSAFAAELGTMKVNEELDALTTMGLDPMRFLVATRVLAAVIVTPMLTIFANVAGLIGAGMVVMSLGFPLTTYLNQIREACTLIDIATGLLKAGVFGLLIAGIGCLRGVQTGAGAQAVGASATRAVVGGIFLIVATDGVFAILFYALGI